VCVCEGVGIGIFEGGDEKVKGCLKVLFYAYSVECFHEFFGKYFEKRQQSWRLTQNRITYAHCVLLLPTFRFLI